MAQSEPKKMNFIRKSTDSPPPPRELSPLARAIAAQPVANAISPVVLTGAVRLFEFLIAVVTGAATYAAYLLPGNEQGLEYGSAIVLVSAAAVLAFQGFEIYSITAFRSHIHQLTRLAVAGDRKSTRLNSSHSS